MPCLFSPFSVLRRSLFDLAVKPDDTELVCSKDAELQIDLHLISNRR